MSSSTESIAASAAGYEAWLGRHCAVVPGALATRRKMAKDAFAILRATCFRFAAQSPSLGLPAAPSVPNCGDAHLANFGTWRDAEGRLARGVNGLDDGALLAPAAPRSREAAAVLAGHAARLAAPRGFVLDEAHVALRAFATPEPAARAKFWAGIDALPPCSAPWAGRWPTCMPAAAAVRAALAGLPADWLRDTARRMAALVTADREGFRRG